MVKIRTTFHKIKSGNTVTYFLTIPKKLVTSIDEVKEVVKLRKAIIKIDDITSVGTVYRRRETYYLRIPKYLGETLEGRKYVDIEIKPIK